MASSWKRSKLGGISRVLASKARRGVGDSPLVVKAGFPTSVADLVVKNRSRLRRAPGWMRRQVAGDGEVGGSVLAETPAAGSPAAPDGSGEAVEQKRGRAGVSDGGVRSPSASGESPEEEPPASPIGAFRNVAASEAPRNAIQEDVPWSRSRKNEVPQRFSVSVELRDEVPQASLRTTVPEEEGPGSSLLEEEWEGSAFVASAERKVREGRSGRGLEMAAKIGFSLLVLALGTKKIAVGVSISAFVVLFLESIGRRLIPLLRSRGDLTKKHASPRGGGPASDVLRSAGASDLIGNRRVPAENLAGSSEFASALIPLPAVEATDRLQANCIPEKRKRDSANKKARRLLRRLVPKKLRVAKSEMEGKLGAKADAASVSSRRGASGQKAKEGETPEEKEEEEVEETAVGAENEDEEEGAVPCSGVPPEVDGTAFAAEIAVPLTNQSLRHLVLLLVVLSGLVGGRFAAMAITVALYSLATSGTKLFKNWKMRRNQSA